MDFEKKLVGGGAWWRWRWRWRWRCLHS